jgi:hypothetical protein
MDQNKAPWFMIGIAALATAAGGGLFGLLGAGLFLLVGLFVGALAQNAADGGEFFKGTGGNEGGVFKTFESWLSGKIGQATGNPDFNLNGAEAAGESYEQGGEPALIAGGVIGAAGAVGYGTYRANKAINTFKENRTGKEFYKESLEILENIKKTQRAPNEAELATLKATKENPAAQKLIKKAESNRFWIFGAKEKDLSKRLDTAIKAGNEAIKAAEKSAFLTQVADAAAKGAARGAGSPPAAAAEATTARPAAGADATIDPSGSDLVGSETAPESTRKKQSGETEAQVDADESTSDKNKAQRKNQTTSSANTREKAAEETAADTAKKAAESNHEPAPRATSLYDELGVSKYATQEDIKQAHKEKTLANHPDRARDDPEAVKRFKAATDAYKVLSDETKRAVYDRAGGGTGDETKEQSARERVRAYERTALEQKRETDEKQRTDAETAKREATYKKRQDEDRTKTIKEYYKKHTTGWRIRSIIDRNSLTTYEALEFPVSHLDADAKATLINKLKADGFDVSIRTSASLHYIECVSIKIDPSNQEMQSKLERIKSNGHPSAPLPGSDSKPVADRPNTAESMQRQTPPELVNANGKPLDAPQTTESLQSQETNSESLNTIPANDINGVRSTISDLAERMVQNRIDNLPENTNPTRRQFLNDNKAIVKEWTEAYLKWKIAHDDLDATNSDTARNTISRELKALDNSHDEAWRKLLGKLLSTTSMDNASGVAFLRHTVLQPIDGEVKAALNNDNARDQLRSGMPQDYITAYDSLSSSETKNSVAPTTVADDAPAADKTPPAKKSVPKRTRSPLRNTTRQYSTTTSEFVQWRKGALVNGDKLVIPEPSARDSLVKKAMIQAQEATKAAQKLVVATNPDAPIEITPKPVMENVTPNTAARVISQAEINQLRASGLVIDVDPAPAAAPPPVAADAPSQQSFKLDSGANIKMAAIGGFSGLMTYNQSNNTWEKSAAALNIAESGANILATQSIANKVPKVSGLSAGFVAKFGAPISFINAGFDGYRAYDAFSQGDVAGGVRNSTQAVGNTANGVAVIASTEIGKRYISTAVGQVAGKLALPLAVANLAWVTSDAVKANVEANQAIRESLADEKAVHAAGGTNQYAQKYQDILEHIKHPVLAAPELSFSDYRQLPQALNLANISHEDRIKMTPQAIDAKLEQTLAELRKQKEQAIEKLPEGYKSTAAMEGGSAWTEGWRQQVNHYTGVLESNIADRNQKLSTVDAIESKIRTVESAREELIGNASGFVTVRDSKSGGFVSLPSYAARYALNEYSQQLRTQITTEVTDAQVQQLKTDIEAQKQFQKEQAPAMQLLAQLKPELIKAFETPELVTLRQEVSALSGMSQQYPEDKAIAAKSLALELQLLHTQNQIIEDMLNAQKPKNFEIQLPTHKTETPLQSAVSTLKGALGGEQVSLALREAVMPTNAQSLPHGAQHPSLQTPSYLS